LQELNQEPIVLKPVGNKYQKEKEKVTSRVGGHTAKERFDRRSL